MSWSSIPAFDIENGDTIRRRHPQRAGEWEQLTVAGIAQQDGMIAVFAYDANRSRGWRLDPSEIVQRRDYS
jgi:hypothetical protein